MKALLMHPNRDFDVRDPLAWNAGTLTEDLALETLMVAMAGDDPLIRQVAQVALLSGTSLDDPSVLYRQANVRDALDQASTVRELYAITAQAIENRRRSWFAIGTRHPSSLLGGAVELMGMHVGVLEHLRDVARSDGARFKAAGFVELFATLERELSDEYLATIRKHLGILRLREGVPMNASLGPGNAGREYRLQELEPDTRGWLRRLLSKRPEEYVWKLPERDEAGARALSDLRDRGVNRVANALAQAVDHVDGFLNMLRTELAFFVGCVNLRDRLGGLRAPISCPRIVATRSLAQGRGIYDPCLALEMGQRLIGNDLAGVGRNLLVITGANQGGKSTFLRALGVAQIMARSGMFVAAVEFETGLHPLVTTHFKREEDPGLKSGKFDEELSRMSEIVDHLVPGALALFNESFAATNEREGSEIARQVVSALLECEITVAFVTHLHPFAHLMHERAPRPTVVLRAERLADGTRTYRLPPGEPLATSHGRDLFERVFALDSASSSSFAAGDTGSNAGSSMAGPGHEAARGGIPRTAPR